jgi:hypothetical protein
VGSRAGRELNEMPGPAYLLERKDQIPLTPEQVTRTQELFDDMRNAAIPTGERMIAADRPGGGLYIR